MSIVQFEGIANQVLIVNYHKSSFNGNCTEAGTPFLLRSAVVGS